jgi:hypothetical protein
MTTTQEINDQKVKNILISVGALGFAYYGFKKANNEITFGVLMYGIAGAVVGSIVNNIYSNTH